MIIERSSRKNGFTFVELLIVVGMLAVVSIAIYTVFSNGVRIWFRVNEQIPKEDLFIFFDKFTSDLRNSFKFTGINFTGDEERIEFATLVKSPRLEKNTVGQIIYKYNPVSNRIVRKRRDFSQVYAERSDKIKDELENIKSLRFRYFYYDIEKKAYFWDDEWVDKEDLPLAVRMEFRFDDGRQTGKFVKTVSIPANGQ